MRLCIAIPTFNRWQKLEKQIDLIVRQVELNNFSKSIELIIIDNNSPDGTYDLLKQKSFKTKINIYKNDTNIGLIPNYLKCLEISKCTYTWVVGDDDRLGDNSIKDVMSIIAQKNGVGLIHLNHKCIDGTDGPVLIESFYNVDIADESIGFVNTLLNNKHTGGFMFITANIVRADLARLIISESKSIKNYLSYPMYLNLRCAFHSGIHYAPSNELICVYNESSWSQRYDHIMSVELPDLWIKLKWYGLSGENIIYFIKNSKLFTSKLNNLFAICIRRDITFLMLTRYLYTIVRNRFVYRLIKLVWTFR
jgi:glycosyltransferase involved in cell wall biosynthesis